MAKRKPRKKKMDGGKLFLGAMTGGLSLLFTGVHQGPKPRKRVQRERPYSIEEMMFYDWIWGD